MKIIKIWNGSAGLPWRGMVKSKQKLCTDREGKLKQPINDAKGTDVSITQVCVVQKQTIIVLLCNKTNL